MHFKRQIGPYRLDVSFNRRFPVLGVNSKLNEDGRHMLLWDFDGVKLDDVVKTLNDLQVEFALPSIHVLCSTVDGNWHAYCFESLPWAEMLYILLRTTGLDQQFLKLGVFRGYMTLRITDKPGTKITPYGTLPSMHLETCVAEDIFSFEKYWAKVRGSKT